MATVSSDSLIVLTNVLEEMQFSTSKLECPRQTWQTTVRRNSMEKAYDINTYRAVHRPSTTMSCDMSAGALRPMPGAVSSANHNDPLPISYRGMPPSIHPFQNHRTRSLILSEEDKNQLTVVCQPINSYNRHRPTRPLWSRQHWRKEPTDSISAFEELQFSSNSPTNDKCSFDSLTPQIMACFIGREEVSELNHHKNSHCQSNETLNKKSESSVDQMRRYDEQDEKEDKGGESEGGGGIHVDAGDEHSQSVPLSLITTSAYCTSHSTNTDTDMTAYEDPTSELNDYPGKKDVEENSKLPNNNNVTNKEHKEKIRKENENQEDFDSKSSDIPAYLFKEPLPHPLNKLDISQMSRDKVNWREVVRWHLLDPYIHSVMDRLFEIDQLQHETEENEIRRALTKQAIRVKPRPLNSRQVTSVTLKPSCRENRCVDNCLQSVCVGNCPSKQRFAASSLCQFCNQSLFGRNGQEEYSYDQQSRLPTDNEQWRNIASSVPSVPTVAIRPQSCNADHPHRSPNRLVLTTAKSYRPKSSTASNCILDCSTGIMFQKQSKESSWDQHSDFKNTISRPKSVIKPKSNRNSLFPGKSHLFPEWNSANPDNREAPLIVQSARIDGKIRKKDKRNLTSISLLDPRFNQC